MWASRFAVLSINVFNPLDRLTDYKNGGLNPAGIPTAIMKLAPQFGGAGLRPCACENEMEVEDAKALVRNGCLCVTECANMPLTPDAIEFLLESNSLYSPGKASNAGGVSCSGFEMAQNSTKIKWTTEEVDQRLRQVMTDIHRNCLQAAERYGEPGNYFSGANIAGFIKVANAMLDQGNT